MKTFADFGIELGGRSGVEVQTTCPQCSPLRRKSKARCLSVNTEKEVWVCHHCDWAGTLKGGVEHQADKRKLIIKPAYQSSGSLPPNLLDWFAKRGIHEAVVTRNRITLQTVYMPQLEEEVPCIAFPYVKVGEVVNIKYRALEPKAFRQVAHAEKTFYGLDDIAGDAAVIVEGELDKLALEVAGINYAVSVPDGAPPAGSKPTDTKFEYLQTCEPLLTRLKKIIIAVDNDEPGKTLEAELSRRLGPERCWRVTWPEGCKDANDVLLKYDATTLRECIEEAKPFPLLGILEVQDVVDDLLKLYDGKLAGGLSTGWLTVDQHYTVRPGELTVVTGIPSHGKSQFLDALAVHLATEHDWRIGLCSPENLPIERHVAKLLEQYTGFPFHDGPSLRLPRFELAPALQWLHDHFVFMVPEDSAWSIDDLLKRAKALVQRYGIRGLILDPWNEFDHSRPSSMTETEYISRSLGNIRRFGRYHGVHVWMVAHPQKLYRQDDGTYPVPTPYDISGSAHWRNKADNCLTVWRDEANTSGEVVLYVQKVRFREVGKVGAIPLRWNKVNGRYESVHEAHNART
jgi:twinkle protein